MTPAHQTHRLNAHEDENDDAEDDDHDGDHLRKQDGTITSHGRFICSARTDSIAT